MIHACPGKEDLPNLSVILFVPQEPPRNMSPQGSVLTIVQLSPICFPAKGRYLQTLPSGFQNLCSHLLIPMGLLHTHLKSVKKEQNNAICSNMDGPRDCHAE